MSVKCKSSPESLRDSGAVWGQSAGQTELLLPLQQVQGGGRPPLLQQRHQPHHHRLQRGECQLRADCVCREDCGDQGKADVSPGPPVMCDCRRCPRGTQRWSAWPSLPTLTRSSWAPVECAGREREEREIEIRTGTGSGEQRLTRLGDLHIVIWEIREIKK